MPKLQALTNPTATDPATERRLVEITLCRAPDISTLSSGVVKSKTLGGMIPSNATTDFAFGSAIARPNQNTLSPKMIQSAVLMMAEHRSSSQLLASLLQGVGEFAEEDASSLAGSSSAGLHGFHAELLWMLGGSVDSSFQGRQRCV